MKESKSVLGGLNIAFVLSLLAALACIPGKTVWAQEKKPVKLSGEQLYAINCSRCHTERYPTERTEAQWKTIVMHMQVRANLPPEQAKEILKYLKENN